MEEHKLDMLAVNDGVMLCSLLANGDAEEKTSGPSSCSILCERPHTIKVVHFDKALREILPSASKRYNMVVIPSQKCLALSDRLSVSSFFRLHVPQVTSSYCNSVGWLKYVEPLSWRCDHI
nr:hypothetical protein [Tanacetum cinerariifolium]